jgi:hypothetical protein
MFVSSMAHTQMLSASGDDPISLWCVCVVLETLDAADAAPMQLGVIVFSE